MFIKRGEGEILDVFVDEEDNKTKEHQDDVENNSKKLGTGNNQALNRKHIGSENN